MKKITLLMLLLLGIVKTASAGALHTDNEPGEGYIFTYSTGNNRDHNGLHIAWSIDRENWHSIGPEHSFLRSDFGRWGSQKRMLGPVTWQDGAGLWHCFFRVNEDLGVLGHTTSKDMLVWRPQAYHYPKNGEKLVQPGDILKEAAGVEAGHQAIINGDSWVGSLHRVPWGTIQALIDGHRLADYKNRLFGELMVDDSRRFANLGDVKASLSLEPGRSKAISDMLIGIFFEDINYAADGGIYAELVQNRDFEYSPADKEGRDPAWNSRKAWTLKGNGATFGIDTVRPIHVNNPHYAVLGTTGTSAALVNEGWGGIPLAKNKKYIFSLFSRIENGKGGRCIIRLVDEGGKVCGQTTLNLSGNDWKKREVVITCTEDVEKASLEISPLFAGNIHFDMISLFPEHTFKGRRNGLRADLAQTLADMHPRFVRFPGGCVAHGDGLDNMYRWKNTIGELEARVPQRNLWGYHQTAGLGYFEYFQFCEDIGAQPLPVLPAGVPCQNSGTGGHGQQCGLPMEHMDEYIQEVLDLIEWANGDAKKTQWGRKRAAQGHAKPFNLKYIGIGNEDLISDVFEERYKMICNAVKEKYPDIIVIGTVGPFWEGSDYEEGWRIASDINLPMVDEHYYNSPAWYIYNQDFYDRYDRAKSKVYLGEYAAHVPGRHNNIETALAEALHLINIERNGDVVSLTSYAPLLAKEGFTQWNPDLIYFNNTEVKPTVGYHVQKLFGQNAGDSYIPGVLKVDHRDDAVRKRVASSLVHDSVTGDYILKMVNLLPAAVNTTVDFNFDFNAGEAQMIVLSGNYDDKTARPVSEPVVLDNPTEIRLPGYSFVVIRFK